MSFKYFNFEIEPIVKKSGIYRVLFYNKIVPSDIQENENIIEVKRFRDSELLLKNAGPGYNFNLYYIAVGFI